MGLQILAIADEVTRLLYDHFDAKRWRDIDLVLSCGDLPPEYLDFLCTSLGVPILYVRGNHDGNYEAARYDGSEDIHGRIVECKGIRIAGFQGCYQYNNGPYQYTEGQMRRMVQWMNLRAWRHGPPDIVLTHAPPAGVHDGDDVCHRGFKCFRAAIEQWQPAAFVHGHTHHHYSRSTVTSFGSTDVINAFPYHVFQVTPKGEALAGAERQPGLR